MQLGRYNVSTLHPAPITSIRFSADGSHFAISTEAGYEVWRTYPLALLKRRNLPGTLSLAVLLPGTPLLVLQGGGNNPLYPPNKAVIYNDKLGLAIAELEFGQRVRGIAVRRETICVALPHRVVVFTYGINPPSALSGGGGTKGKLKEVDSGFWLRKLGEWETAENETGLMAISTSPGSTLLALLGRQAGHVQLISLPPCASPPGSVATGHNNTFRSPIILAHTHPLSSLTCSADGLKIITTSERGTLLRVWNTTRGHLERELRRGVDRAEMWGASFEPPPNNLPDRSSTHTERTPESVVGWSDKGTIHIWSPTPLSTQAQPPQTLTHMLSRNLPLPKYFSSTASSAQYHLPRKNPHAFAGVVGAAAGKAGVRGKGLEEGDEWSERFVVGWIAVSVSASEGKKESASAGTAGPSGGSMGSREERRSFGSDMTSRTATPTFRPKEREGTDTPHALPRRQSPLSTADWNSRGRSGSNTSAKSRFKTTPVPTGSGGSVIEHQLVAITFSGDWYRLKIPSGDVDPDDRGKKGKCELVEYRRLDIGGGGW